MPKQGDARGLHGVPLTSREIEVLKGLAQGLSRGDVGKHLGISGLTVKSHLSRMTKKSGLSEANQMVLVMWAMREGYLECPCAH